MPKLEEKIEKYTEDLLDDLVDAHLTEDEKADIFAKVENHLHQAIVSFLQGVLPADEVEKIETVLSAQDYDEFSNLVRKSEVVVEELDKLVEHELKLLKKIIIEEQNNGTARA